MNNTNLLTNNNITNSNNALVTNNRFNNVDPRIKIEDVSIEN
jgi:hypothetical protein